MTRFLNGDASKLGEFLNPATPLPPNEIMISTALDILNHSAHGQQLVDFVRINNIAIRIISTPQPTTYLPETNIAYIGFSPNNPVSPSRFVMMMAGILREAQQESAGIHHPDLKAPLQEHMKVSMAKHEDKVWYMCTVASELNAQDIFTEYNFLEELGKMGYHESLQLYLRRSKGGL